MPDNLRITTPVNNSTSGIARPNQAGQTNHAAPVDPGRVPKTGKDTEGGWQSADLLLSGSVFSKFLRQLQQIPGLDRTLQKLLGDAAAKGLPIEGTGQGGGPGGSRGSSSRAFAGTCFGSCRR